MICYNYKKQSVTRLASTDVQMLNNYLSRKPTAPTTDNGNKITRKMETEFMKERKNRLS